MTHAEAANQGTRKAAILLLTLPEEMAAGLMSKLSADEIESVAAQITEIQSVTSAEHARVLDEFVEAGQTFSSEIHGGWDSLTGMLSRLPTNSNGDILSRLRNQYDGHPFGFLNRMDPTAVVQLIKGEHPQCVALILSNVTPAQAARIIARLPTEQQIEVIRRIAEVVPSDPETMQALEASLKERITKAADESNRGYGIFRVAEILSVIDRGAASALREHLRVEAPEFADEVFRLTVNFQQIHQMSDEETRLLLRTVPIPTWALAMKGCSVQLRDKIIHNLTPEDLVSLQAEDERVRTAQASEAEAAQVDIVRAIYRLRQSGRILWAPRGEDNKHFTTDQSKAA